MTFKVGDTVRRIDGSNVSTPIGFEGTIRGVDYDSTGDSRYLFDDGAWGYAYAKWELVAPTGPVRTVTRREVVPGVWSGVVIERPTVAVNLHVHFSLHDPSNDELRAAAAVLLELAGDLSDGE